MSGAIITAKRLLPRPDDWVEGGGLLIVEGDIERVLRSPAEVQRARAASGFPVEDFADRVLVPGTICAHAHLELSALRGRLEPGTEMLPWIRGVIEERGQLGAEALERAALDGARSLLASGTTLVGDIESSQAEALPPKYPGPRRIAFRELLDGGDARRTAAVVASVEEGRTPSELRTEGLSPHAPHTVSAELLRAAQRLSSARGLPVQMHWSETLEETEWMLHGRGPFAELLADSPRVSGLDWIERASLLRPGLSLVHGNLPLAGEPERLAAHGVALVHCPGSHAFFERAPFPLELYRRAGVTLALGTDSLASNSALDMGRELRLLRASAPALSPAEAWELATLGGARALGLAGRVGELAPGARADFAVFELDEAGAEASLDALTAAEPRPTQVWIGGRPALI